MTDLKIPCYFPELFSEAEKKWMIEDEHVRVFRVYMPLSSGERIYLQNLWFTPEFDPRGLDLLSEWEKEDLESYAESLDDAPNRTPEQLSEAYDACRINPLLLEWKPFSKGEAIKSFLPDPNFQEVVAQ